MSNELVSVTNLFPEINKKLQPTIKYIAENLPQLDLDKQIFGKTDSQLMRSTLTLHQLTPLRSLHQILANIERIEMALKDNYFNIEKKKLEIEERQHCLAHGNLNKFQTKLFEIEVREKQSQIESANLYISGAIRQLAYFADQYKSIIEHHKITSFTEADFEREEVKYHIMTAFNQGITAARSRGGLIDEGNHIYLQQLGISGRDAQDEVDKLFKAENTATDDRYELLIKFLNEMAEKYTKNVYTNMNNRGIKNISNIALLTGGEKCQITQAI